MLKFWLCILFVAPSLINYSRPCGQVEGARVWRSPLDIWTFRASWIRIAWLQIVTCLNFWEKVAHKQFNRDIKNDHLTVTGKMFGLLWVRRCLCSLLMFFSVTLLLQQYCHLFDMFCVVVFIFLCLCCCVWSGGQLTLWRPQLLQLLQTASL